MLVVLHTLVAVVWYPLCTAAMGFMVTTRGRGDDGVPVQIWKQGIRNVPRRVRVVLKRKRNEDTNAKEALYTVVEVVPTKKTEFKGLLTKTVEADE